VKIRSITLGELLNLTGAEPDVLKLDCEGCEYDIIEHDYETLRMFRELGIECHPYLRGKELGDCLKYLSRDFRCSVAINLKSRTYTAYVIDMGVSLRVAEMLMKVRRALYSRYLFDNWFSLLIKYALIKIGFNVKLTAKVDNCAFELSPEAFACLVSMASRGLVKISCVDGGLYVNGGRYGEHHGAWVYDKSCNCYVRNNVKFKQIRCAIYQVFDDGDYEPLDVSGRVVVDVGAYVGDSAIYFALRGAKKVIAVEPHPGAFAEMLDNIKLNNLEGVIIPINAGLASRPGSVCVLRMLIPVIPALHTIGLVIVSMPSQR